MNRQNRPVRTRHMKDRVNTMKSTVVVPSGGTTLEELQENVNQKIPELTRKIKRQMMENIVTNVAENIEKTESCLQTENEAENYRDASMRPTSRTPRLSGLESPKL